VTAGPDTVVGTFAPAQARACSVPSRQEVAAMRESITVPLDLGPEDVGSPTVAVLAEAGMIPSHQVASAPGAG